MQYRMSNLYLNDNTEDNELLHFCDNNGYINAL
jgi:hypothetical protein